MRFSRHCYRILPAIAVTSAASSLASSALAQGAAVPAISGRPMYYDPDLTPPRVKNLQTDVCIYGGTSAGVAAALQVARAGKTAIILEPSNRLGGVSSGGLGETDIGNKAAIGGISREFYRRMGQKYGEAETWKFEPHVAEAVFKEMAAEAKTPVYYRQFLKSVKTSKGHLASITMENGLTVSAQEFIDATYEGDLMAMAGVKYAVGREANTAYGETLDGVQIQNGHQFTLPVSPYRVEGDPKSGLLPGITPNAPGAIGSGDKRIQAYNFRLCLTTDPNNRIPFEQPANYHPDEYVLLSRYLQAGWPANQVFQKFDPIHNSRSDLLLGPNQSQLTRSDINDPQGFIGRIKKATGPLTLALKNRLSPATKAQLDAFDETKPPSDALLNSLLGELNAFIQGPSLYTPTLFSKVNLSESTKSWLQNNPQGQELARLNTRLLQEAYPNEIGAKPYPKVDKNNHGAFSTDDIGQNYAYPEASYAQREKIYQAHVTYQQGLMWFLGNDPTVAVDIRSRWSEWGLAKDEFTATGGWPGQLYVREARRMISDYVMAERNCRGTEQVTDPVGLAAYTMDSHNVQRFVKDGRVYNEGNVQVQGFAPYPIAYRSIVPKKAECDNLVVPVCLSATHIAYGSIRMEPVFMILGQSAATATCLAIDRKSALQDVPYSEIKARLLAENQILAWQPTGVAAPSEPMVPALPLAKATPDANSIGFFKRLNAGQKQTVVVYGTSLTAGGAWTNELKNWFDAQYPGLVTFVNSGLSGKTSDEGVAQEQTKVLDYHPDLVFVEFSINDAHTRFNMSVLHSAQNLDRIVSAMRAQNPGIAVVLQVMSLPWDGSTFSARDRPNLQSYNDNYRSYAREHNTLLLDHNPAWQKMMDTSLDTYHEFLPDGLHPNRAGNLAVTWPAVRGLLEQARSLALTAS